MIPYWLSLIMWPGCDITNITCCSSIRCWSHDVYLWGFYWLLICLLINTLVPLFRGVSVCVCEVVSVWVCVWAATGVKKVNVLTSLVNPQLSHNNNTIIIIMCLFTEYRLNVCSLWSDRFLVAPPMWQVFSYLCVVVVGLDRVDVICWFVEVFKSWFYS